MHIAQSCACMSDKFNDDLKHYYVLLSTSLPELVEVMLVKVSN